MNEQALNYSYELFKKDGYTGTLDQYKQLISSNKEAIDYSYNLFKNDGYSGSVNDFAQLISPMAERPVASKPVDPVKKKDTVSPFVDGGSELTKFDPTTGKVVQETTEFTKPKEKDFSGLEVQVDESILNKKPREAKPMVSGESTKVVSPKGLQKEEVSTELDKNLEEFQASQKKGAKSYLENIAINLGLGTSYANEAVASIPESVINILAIPQNYIAEKTGLPIGVTAEGIKESWGITNPLLDYVKEDQKILSGEVSKFMAERYEDPSIVGNFEKGNYQEGFELLGSAITQSLPISVGLMIGGAYTAPSKLATVATLGFTEDQREELAAMDPTMSEAEKTLKAAGMAGMESVFSSIGTGTLGRVYKDIAKREGTETAKKIFTDGLITAYETALKKGGLPVAVAGNSLEEGAVRVSQNVISGRPIMDGVADAFITGGGSGVVFGAPISAVNAKRYIENKITSYDTKRKVTEILKDKADNMAQVYNVPVSSEINVPQLEIANLPNSRNLLINNLKKSVSDGQITEEDAKQSLFVFDKVQQVSNAVKDLDVSIDDKAKVASLLRQRDDLKTKIQNKDDVLVVQEKRQIEEINNQIQSIISKPKSTYRVDGKDVSVDAIDELIKTKSKEELLAMNIEINNDQTGLTERLQSVLETKPEEQDAIQEQAAGEVPVQPGATVSEEVAQGEPQAEPQGVAEESQEEVKVGSIFKWDVFGNEDTGDWTVVDETTTRGGKPAVTLSKVYVEDIANGKTYTKEYADKNGIRYENEFTVTHIVPLNELKTESVTQISEPQIIAEEGQEVIPTIESAKSNLAKRLSGDELLNSQDLIDELNDNKADIDQDGMVTVYHRTTPENKAEIERTGEMQGLEDGVFFSTKETGQNQGYGEAVVKLKVPVEQLIVDDTFGDEAHLRIPTAKAGQIVNVKEYIQADPQKVTQEESTPQATKSPADFALELQDKYGVELDFLGSPESETLSVSRIVVPKGQRGQGIGAKVMEEIVSYADSNNKKLVLTPSKDFGGTSVKRLTDFYKRFGFVENKGKNKDFTIRDTMYRVPEVTIQEESAPKKSPSKPRVAKVNREEIISRPAFTPITAARQWLLSGGKLRSTQSEENKRRGVGVGKGVREETGMGGVEMRKLAGVIDNKKGLSIEVAAERIYDGLSPELQASMDVQDIRDAMIEVLLSEDRKAWIDNQDRETSENQTSGLDEYIYSQLTDEERSDFDQYKQEESYNEYRQENAKKLAKEYDAYVKSKVYQDYIEELYERNREGRSDAQDQNDGRGQEEGTDAGTDSVQAKEVEGKLDELLKLDAKEKSTGQKALDYLDGLLKDYDKIEKEGLGINIALPVIKKIVQGIRALVKTGMSLNDAIKRVAKENGVSVRDVMSNINSVDESISRRKKVTVNEMAALKDQIRLEARAARGAKRDLNAKRKALAAKVIAARRKGSITATQARTLVSRISGVNLDNPIMVDRLVAYIDKVFDNANYAADMIELRKLQKQAKRKNHTSMKDFVDRFTSINPELIPLDKIQDYKEALDFLNNRTPSYARMNEMLPEIESYQVSEEFDAAKTMDALMSKYESIALNQVGSVEEYVDLIKDINSFKRKAFQLLQNEDIIQKDYDDLINMVGKDQAEVEKRYEKEITQIKKDLIAEIKKQRPKPNPEFTKEENDLIKEYLELSDADLQGLSPEDLFVLNDLLENISNGEIDYYRFKNVVSKAANNKAGIDVGKQLKESKLSLGSAELRKKMAQFESSFWEGLLGLGRATSGPLQKFIISPFNRAIGSYEKFIRDGFNDFLKLKNKYKISDKDMNKIGVLTTYLQEYMAQFDSKNNGVKDIGKRDWFKKILDSETMRDDYSPEELKIIEEIHESLPKDNDGNVDPKAVYDSYMSNNGKFFTKNEKGFFDEVMEWKKNNSTSKQKAANEMSGNAFKEIPFHMLRSRYAGQTSQITPSTSGDNGMVRIKAGTGKERASEAVGAINTNFEKLFIKGLEQTGRDYFLSKTLKDINNVLASAKKELAGDKDPLVKAISYTLSDALAYEFSNTASQNLLKRLVQARAAMTLFDPIRAGVEFTSTLLSFGLRARTLSGYKNLFGSQGDMRNLLEFTDSPLRLRQNINNAIDINDGRIEPQGMLMKWTNFLSGLPERTMMVTSWMPTFTSEFQRITGEKFDMKKFNDSSAYREKYGKAVKEASAVADAQTEKIIGPTTKAGQRRDIIIFPGKTVGRDTVSGQILGFFSNYPYREVTEFVNGFREAGEVLKKSDTVDALSQLQKPLGIALNVAAYGFLSSVVYASRLILLGDDEEEERGSKLLEELMTAKGFIEETAANAAALAASKYAGGGRATLQLLGTLGMMMTDDEETKATIKKMLKGSVYVDPLPTQRLSGFGTADKVNTAIVKYIPQFVVLSNIIIDGLGGLNEVKAIYDKVEKKGIEALTEDEELKVLALSVMFTGTQLFLNYQGSSLPSYNTLKAGMKTVKEEAGVSDISAGKVPAKKKSSGGRGSSRGGGMNKTDMKKYNPELYNQMYGPGSAAYEVEQELKAFEKEQREFKKKMKAQLYGGD
jgi:predicted GNAT family N-acyltransferase